MKRSDITAKEKAEFIINNINNVFKNNDYGPYRIKNRKNQIINDIDFKIKVLRSSPISEFFNIIWWKKVKKYVIQFYDIKYQRKLKIEQIKNNQINI